MLRKAMDSGKTLEVNDIVREEMESLLIDIAGPYGEMAVSVALDIAQSQKDQAMMQVRLNDDVFELAIKMTYPLNPLRVTASSRGASLAMLKTLTKKGVIKTKNRNGTTMMLVRVKRTDNKVAPEPKYYQPQIFASFA